MNLAEHLSLRTPLTWVTTDEPGRVIEAVISDAERAAEKRSVYRMDSLQGFITWDDERNRWVKVLINDPQMGGLMPTQDPSLAFSHVLENRGIMLIENAHGMVEMMGGFFLSLVFEYREAFYSNDLDKIPPQFILISYKDEVPKELARMTSHVIHELPDENDLEHITDHLRKNGVRTRATLGEIARAGVGLSETEFISSALLSTKHKGHIDASFVNARKMDLLKKNGVLEVRTPELAVESLGGLDNAKALIRQIGWLWNNPEEAEELDIEPLRRLLLVGVPGTGKSLVCEAIASMLGLDLGKGGVSSSMSKWVGESEANMRRMFATLKRMAPIVLWIDEFGRDMSGGQSSGSVDGGTTDRVHGEFLTGLQELPKNVFLAAAANRIESLPPEMTRADRFDRVMFVGFPTQEEREEIFRIHLGKHAHEHNTAKLASVTPFFTGAEIKSLIKEVRFDVAAVEHRRPTTDEIVDHAPRVKGRVWVNHRDAIVQMYRRAVVEWDWASTGQQEEADAVLRAANASMPTQAAPQATPKVPQFKPKDFSMKAK